MTFGKEKLKPCPFCGKPHPVSRRYEADGVKLLRDRYVVLCDYSEGGCGAESGWYHSPEEAAAMWNQRKRRWKNDRG